MNVTEVAHTGYAHNGAGAAAPGPANPFGLPSIAAHSSYWDQGNPALINMGRIIDGRLDVTAPTFTP
jgi:hypothetical protein